MVKGDSLWKIAVRYKVGLDEIIAANPQFADPNLIYPGQKVYVPLDDPATLSFEEQVVELVNAYRAQYGLSALTADWELARVARYKSGYARPRLFCAQQPHVWFALRYDQKLRPQLPHGG